LPSSTDVAIEKHHFLIEGARMRYLRAGSGPPLVLVHGLMGHAFSWRFAMPVFAKHFTVYAVDLLGAGYSDHPHVDQSLRANAERLLRFVDEVPGSPCRLLGSSRGGGITMRAAALAPRRVEQMVLVSPINPWSAHGRGIAPVLSHPWIAPVFARVAPRVKSFQRYLLRRLYGDPRRILPGTLEGYAAPYTILKSFAEEMRILKTWNRDLDELGAVLPRIAQIPTLLVWGNRDAAVIPESAEPLRRNFRRCRLIMLDGIGHIPYEEVPDEFNRVVNDFLLAPPPE
jgi:pimeloyl-ACP methyl ester carboxylesterase